jgi:hypothetical protein
MNASILKLLKYILQRRFPKIVPNGGYRYTDEMALKNEVGKRVVPSGGSA